VVSKINVLVYGSYVTRLYGIKYKLQKTSVA